MIDANKILEMRNITKSYSGTTVLHDMNFNLCKGEIHCIVGENGAGKSTFIKILSGAILPDYGEIIAFGHKCNYSDPQTPIKMGISTIYQDVDLVDTLTVADNIFLGDEICKGRIIKTKQQNEEARKLLTTLKVDLDSKTLVEYLSPANKQSLQMVKALHRKAKIIIMDEPTASLGEEESQALVKIVKQLAKDGIAIIYISHYLEEVFDLANKITVIKDGYVSGCYNASEVTNEEIITAMVGREASLFYQKEKVTIGDVQLEIKNLSKPPLINNISFQVRKGEILGIGGLVGSGRTELMRLIFGADKAKSGTIIKNNEVISIKSPRDAILNKICMLGENRKEDGMFLQRSIAENICVVKNEEKFFVNPNYDNTRAKKLGESLNLKMSHINQEIEALSGGNQQKSIVARWLMTDCDVIIFDEPSKGVDIGAREEIYQLMVELTKQGKSIIMVSSDMPELLSMSDRICVLREGELVETLLAEGLTEEKLIKIYLNINENEENPS